MICLATAHPAKFPEAIDQAGVDANPELPHHIPKEIEDKANSYFQRIYNVPPHPTLTINEVLDLLKNGIRKARNERVSTEHQHRQPVRMCQGRGRQEVGRAGASRGGAEHEAAAEPGLGVSSGGKTHPLFVLAPVKRQAVLHVLQGFSEAGHIAMAENAEPAAAKAMLDPVDFDELIVQIAHDGLCHRQRDGLACSCHWNSPLFRPDAYSDIDPADKTEDTRFATGCKMQ